MSKATRFLALLLALAFSGALLAGCANAPVGAGGEDKELVFTIGTTAELDTLSPLTTWMMNTMEMIYLVYDSLMRYDENLEPKPSLAKDVQVSADQLTWTFTLHDGVKFHDGKPLTSADVQYTMELMMDTGLGYLYGDALTDIVSIECPDAKTVVITTGEPVPGIGRLSTPIMPKHILEAIPADALETWANEAMIGSGPFKLGSTGDNFVRLERNDDYYGQKSALDAIVFVTYENADSMAQAVIIGELDGACNLNAAQLAQLQADKNIEAIAGELPGFEQVAYNCYQDPESGGNPLLLDKIVRQAIEYGTDKEKIIGMAYGGAGIACESTIVNPSNPGYYNPPEKRLYSPEKGAALLEANGYVDTDGDGVREKDGQPLEFRLFVIGDRVNYVKSGQIVAEGCAELGIKINLESMDSGLLTDKIYEMDYDMFIWGWGSDNFSGGFGILTTDQIGNLNEPGYSNPEYDALVSQLRTTFDTGARNALFIELQKILYEDLPFNVLIYDSNIQAYRSDRWSGLVQNPKNGGTWFYSGSTFNYLNIKPVS